MGLFIVDVESDGPVPPLYSMVCFGAVFVDVKHEDLSQTFYGKTRPLIGAKCDLESLAISGFTHEERCRFDSPEIVITEFARWVTDVNTGGQPVMLSDNIAYDWQWINYYMHYYLEANVFGYSGRRIGDLYCGLVKDMHAPWKHLRDTLHDHNPVNDCIGNAEVLLKLKNKYGLRF